MSDVLFGNNNKAVIKKVANRNFHSNKKRNILAVIAIALCFQFVNTVYEVFIEKITTITGSSKTHIIDQSAVDNISVSPIFGSSPIKKTKRIYARFVIFLPSYTL